MALLYIRSMSIWLTMGGFQNQGPLIWTQRLGSFAEGAGDPLSIETPIWELKLLYGVSKNRGSYYRPQTAGLLLQGHPLKRTPFPPNAHAAACRGRAESDSEILAAICQKFQKPRSHGARSMFELEVRATHVYTYVDPSIHLFVYLSIYLAAEFYKVWIRQL